jgi:hypothetical protein
MILKEPQGWLEGGNLSTLEGELEGEALNIYLYETPWFMYLYVKVL